MNFKRRQGHAIPNVGNPRPSPVPGLLVPMISTEKIQSSATCMNNAAGCLTHLLLSEHLSDVIFVCKDEVRLPAHKLVLSIRSEVFEAMFYGALAEKEGVVSIKDIDSMIMKELLRFVYTDKPNIEGDNVLGLLYGAKKYGLESLIQLCSSFLKKKMDVKSVCMIHEQASLYGMEDLKSRCFKMMLQNANGLFGASSFLHLKPDVLLCLLKHDELQAQEIDVFKAALQWSKLRCEENGIQVTGSSMRNSLGEAMFQTRFPIMDMKTFANEVVPTGILTQDELLEIYHYCATKDAHKVLHFVTKIRQNSAQQFCGFGGYQFQAHDQENEYGNYWS